MTDYIRQLIVKPCKRTTSLLDRAFSARPRLVAKKRMLANRTLNMERSTIDKSVVNKSLGPFRATQIWHEVIDHLRTHVVVKRRRHKIRRYNSCFTGSDAVDVVLCYLLSDSKTFSSDLSREKAVKLCQTLMDKKVFEPACSRTSEVKKMFDDSHNKLYRFIGNRGDKENQSPDPSDSSDEEEEEGQEEKKDVGVPVSIAIDCVPTSSSDTESTATCPSPTSKCASPT